MMPSKIVDACCLINLYASGRPEAMLRAFDDAFFLPDEVRAEALYIRRHDENDPSVLVPEAIDLSNVLRAGLIQECRVEGDAETRWFVDFAMELDDGESACLAIAKCRDWTVASDDRKALRIAQSHGISTITTPELAKRWAENSAASDHEVAEALRAIQLFARFFPRRNAPLRDWWTEILASDDS